MLQGQSSFNGWMETQIKKLSIVPLKPKGIPNSKRQKGETKTQNSCSFIFPH